MKKLLEIALLTLIAANAFADNLFAGPYVGLDLGYARGNSTGDNTYHDPSYNITYDTYQNIPFSYGVKADGFFGGGSFGNNWAINDKFVIGLVADVHLGDIGGHKNWHKDQNDSRNACQADASASSRLKSFETIRLKYGFVPTDNLLLYIPYGRVCQWKS